MNIERARDIVRSLTIHSLVGIVQPTGDEVDLSGVSIREMLEACDVVRAANDRTKTAPAVAGLFLRRQVVPDERLVAALFVLFHFDGADPDHAKPVIIGGGKALCVLTTPPDYQLDVASEMRRV